MPYALRLIVISPKLSWFEGGVKVRRQEAIGTAEINGCRGTPWSEELHGKVLHGAAWWQVRSGVERMRVFLHT